MLAASVGCQEPGETGFYAAHANRTSPERWRKAPQLARGIFL
jgi:hypothetical protein